MEFLFEILIQYGGELLIQLLVEAAAEIGMRGLGESLGETFAKPKSPVLATFGFALWGLIAGGISLLLSRTPLSRTRNGVGSTFSSRRSSRAGSWLRSAACAAAKDCASCG